MKRRLRIVVPILLLVVAGVFIYRYISHRDDGSEIRFSGNIEVTEAQLSFRIPGRLKVRLVDEGDSVKAGQVVARLENTDQTIGIAQAEANLAYAEAVLAELEAGSRKEDLDRVEAKVMQARYSLAELENGSRSEDIESASAEHDRAKAAEQSSLVKLRQAKVDYERYEKLYKDGSVSASIFETYRTLYDTAQNLVKEAQGKSRSASEQLNMLRAGARIEQINRAKAVLKQSEAEYALIKAGPRQESIDQAKAKVRVAAENVKQARQQLSYTELVAPMDAVVLGTSVEVGEYLNPASPVMTLGQLNSPWLRGYVNEKNLGRIQLNQQVEVTTDSFPSKSYIGRLSYISSQAEFTPKTVQTFDERVKLMYRIKVTLDNPANELKPGMPADGLINVAEQ